MIAFAYSSPGVYRSIACLVFVTLSTACTIMQPLSATGDQTLSSQIEVGDKVEITRADGSVLTFKVSDVSVSGIGGGGEFVAYSDIRQVSIRQVRMGPTVGIIVGIVVVAALVGGGGGGGGGSGVY